MNKPRISIITVCYNAASDIEHTMRSVLSQRYDNLEYIIIDGKSKDNTVEIINKVISEYPNADVVFSSEPDNGLYDAMNKGILKARGEWVNIMNAGDYFVDDNVLCKVFSNPLIINKDIVYGDSIIKNGNTFIEEKAKDCYDRLKYLPIYRHGASFVRTKVHREFLYDLLCTQYKWALDYNSIYRMYRAGKTFQYVDTPVLVYEEEGISNHPLEGRWLCYKISCQDRRPMIPFFWFIRSLLSISIKKIMR